MTSKGPSLRRVPTAVAAVLIVVIIIVVIFPIYWMVSSSLSNRSQFTYPPQFLPLPPSLDSYVDALTRFPLARWFANTLIVALGTTALALIVSIPAGLSLSRFRTPLNKGFGGFVLVTQMIPATLLVVPMYIIFARIGLLNQLPGLILANTAFAVPLATWMLRGFFDSIPVELEEAARVDGCTHVGAFARITVPLSAPGVAAVAVFCFLIAWGEFFFARTLVSSDTQWVLSLGLNSFQGQYTTAWSSMLAAAVLFTLPPVLFFVLVQRHLASGLTSGAVKG